MASSSNLIRVAYIAESTYGETPVAGNFETARFTSEKLSGSPQTTESKQIRVDRMSSGQITTGLNVEGALSIEVAKEKPIDDFMESAMYSTWATMAQEAVDLTFTAATRNLLRATGTWGAYSVGDFITLGSFVNAANNVVCMITEVTDTTNIKISAPVGMVDEVATGTTVKRADKLVIGSTKKSFSMEKAYTDLTTKGIIYKGMITSQMSFTIAWGDIVTGSFNFMGNSHTLAASAGEFITNGRTINAAATTNSMNGSIDMPFLASSAIGTFGPADFDIKSVSISLNNNLTAQTVIGSVAPKDFSAGTANISVDVGAYLSNSAWAVMPKKLSQEAFAIGFILKNAGGWYGFYLPALQTSFDDPSSGGQNQDNMIEMKGSARVSDTGGSALVLYRS